ncbi:Lrp/AsnC family transcriptional regulator [Candidatus Woesearchaeota archaeon]|nr:Lrp/AsnC family transcriptional regulator [Candidatus Woesearchaeota archaeon]
MKAKSTKLLILKNLRSNARKSFTDISRATKIPVTTVFDNYHKFLNKKVITRHTSLIDFKQLGYYYRSFLFINARCKSELLSFLCEHRNVNSISRISTYDFFIDTVFPGLKEFHFFLDEVRDFGLMKLEVHEVIEHIKKEEFFCD